MLSVKSKWWTEKSNKPIPIVMQRLDDRRFCSRLAVFKQAENLFKSRAQLKVYALSVPPGYGTVWARP